MAEASSGTRPGSRASAKERYEAKYTPYDGMSRRIVTRTPLYSLSKMLLHATTVG